MGLGVDGVHVVPPSPPFDDSFSRPRLQLILWHGAGIHGVARADEREAGHDAAAPELAGGHHELGDALVPKHSRGQDNEGRPSGSGVT